MKRFKADVVVLGSGAAGIMAAVEAHEKGADVLIAGKGAVGKGTCTSLAGGFFSLSSQNPTTEESFRFIKSAFGLTDAMQTFTPEEHYRSTMEAGRGINDRQMVELVSRGAREKMDKLKSMGTPLLDIPSGCSVDNQGNRKNIPGMVLAQAMQNIIEERDIKSLTGFHCLDFVIEKGRIAGVLGITAEGEPAFINAPSVVLATGGAGGIYQRHDNPAGIIGDGYAMALRAGLQLQDMEFVQFYPVGLAQPGLPEFIFYPPYPPEAKVRDADGRNVFEELENCETLNQAVMLYRDTSSILFYRKHIEGGLFLDLTEVPDAAWNEYYSLRLLSRYKFDFRSQPFQIAPITHFFIGGLVVNTQAETELPGLFAAGEVAGGFHGANRMGGNALTECIVFGSIAGTRAAEHAKDAGGIEISASGVEKSVPSWASGKGGAARPEFGELFGNIKKTAWENAGVIRSEDGMQKGLSAVSALEGDLEALTPNNVAEGLRHNQARSALLTLRCIIETGLRREESRGAFFREDFPEKDDTGWQRNIRISLDNSAKNLLLEDTPLIS